MRARGLVVGLCVALGGCGTFVSETSLNPAPRRLGSRDPRSVELFASGAPPRPHVDVALIEVSQNSGQGTGVMIETARRRAAELGCDAIVIGGMGQDFRSVAPLSYTETTMHATCVVYRRPDDPAVPPAPPPPAPTAAPSRRPHPRTCVDRDDFWQHHDCVVADQAR